MARLYKTIAELRGNTEGTREFMKGLEAKRQKNKAHRDAEREKESRTGRGLRKVKRDLKRPITFEF